MAFDLALSDLVTIGPRFVGAAFIWAGAIKAIAPHTFRSHLRALDAVSSKFVAPAVSLAAGLETAWGLMLLVDAASSIAYPATVLLLLVLTSISWWGVRSGKAKDCGCYGGFIQPSISQSIAINSAFAALIIAAWLLGTPSTSVAPWQIAIIVTGGLGFGLLGHVAQRFEFRHGRLMFETSPLKVGNRWRHSWADGQTARIDGEMLVAFLGPNCPYCSMFVKIANAMVQSPHLPRVVGVMSATDEEVRAYSERLGIRFPVATVSQSLMGRLARAVPTAVIVESGKIQEMWVGDMPPKIVSRFRDAFFPGLPDRVAESATAS